MADVPSEPSLDSTPHYANLKKIMTYIGGYIKNDLKDEGPVADSCARKTTTSMIVGDWQFSRKGSVPLPIITTKDSQGSV
jgi:hypothetical protein